MRSIRRKV